MLLKRIDKIGGFFYNYICLYFYQNVEIFFAQSTFNNVINSGGGRGEEESIAMAY